MKHLIVATLFVTLGCSKPQSEKPSPTTLSGVIPGEVVVQVSNSNIINSLGRGFQATQIDADLQVFLLKKKDFSTAEIEKIKTTPGVLMAEPNFRIKLNSDVPRDPKWLELWAMKNYGQDSRNGTEGLEDADIKATQAWKVTRGSRDVVVAIIDTGIDYSHPDLKENIWVNQKELDGIPGVDDDGNGYADDKYGWDFVSATREAPYHGQLGDPDPMDDNGHGTHVAGTIGASANNGAGVVGVNWVVRMMGCKFLSGTGSGSSVDAYRAIRYATKNGVDIMSNSWGGGEFSQLLEMAIKEAAKEGVLFVAAAGNDENDNDAKPSYPANYKVDNVLSVAASDNRDELASFSNYGYKTVHLAAPGVAITSTYPVALSSNTEPYRAFSGTSMATPHVSGAAALVLAANPALKKDPIGLKKRLMEAVDWRPQMAGRVASGGRLNLLNAVTGTRGFAPPMNEGWVEESYQLSTPRHPTEKMNQAWTIKKEGAVALQLHVKSAIIDAPYDLALIYDGLYRFIGSVPAEIQDYWLPAVIGDTAYLKFSNSLVAIRHSKVKKVEDPKTETAATICYQENSGQWMCEYHEAGTPFANFNSEGVEIDKIRYLPKGGSK